MSLDADPAFSDRPVYVISVAADLCGMHPQTLRTYDRLGLVSPGRTAGRGRRYSERDIMALREIARLSQQEGVSLPGVRRILELQAQVQALQAQVRELACALDEAREQSAQATARARAELRRDLVPVRQQPTSVVLWRRPPRRG